MATSQKKYLEILSGNPNQTESFTAGPLTLPTPATKPTTTNLSYNPSAVSSPARDQYTNGLAQQPTQTSTNQNTPPAGATPTPTGSAGASAYQKYLDMFSADTANQYRTNAEAANTRLADLTSRGEKFGLDAKTEYNKQLDTSGRFQNANQESAGLSDRRNTYKAGVMALEENAAARSAQVASDTYKSYIDQGKSAYEAQTAADKAVQDQKNEDRTYDLQKSDRALADKKFQEDQRQFGLTYALEQQKLGLDREKAGLAGGQSQAKPEVTQSIGIINDLLSKGTGSITGALQNPLNIYGITNGDKINSYKQLKGLLALGARQLIKGTGAISDYESKTLDSAASSLGRNLSNEDFDQALKKTRGVLKTNAGLPTEVTVKNPETGETFTASLGGKDIYELITEGNVVEYK